MVSEAEITFRLRGIPRSFSKSKVKDLVRTQLSLEDAIRVTVRSLACNPVRKHETVATLNFTSLPALLSGKREHFLDFELDDKDGRLEFDTHFEGFTPLHSAQDKDCEFDIVAISGLNGHAFGSFKQKEHVHMWLRDDLPRDFPRARIFTYGYETRGASIQNVYDVANAFRSRLNAIRRHSTTRPPRALVIVAHSLGGIVVKAAVNAMRESNEPRDRANLQYLRSIFLFGVPNHGMNIESLVPMIHESARRTLLYPLDANNSPTLREIGKRFLKVTRRIPDFESFYFYETMESPTAIIVEGQWQMSGPPAVLVSVSSATHGTPHDDLGHRIIPVNHTHRDLVKFTGAHDDVYQTVLDRLKATLEDAQECLQSHCRRLSKVERSCLQSLAFSEEGWREDDITNAEGTCSWVLDHPNFTSWLKDPQGLLWVLGNPGSGKSTLMKYVVQHRRENQTIGLNEVVAAFFVHGRGHELQKSPLGLYRSLLRQILPYFPTHLADLTTKYLGKPRSNEGSDEQSIWRTQELRQFFLKILPQLCHRRSVVIFVDALDEIGEEDAVKIIRDFEKLTTNLNDPMATLKICFSCRYYPVLRTTTKLSVSVERENAQDISKFVESYWELKDLPEPGRSQLQKIIIGKARGIFQWVTIILGQVTRLRRSGKTTQQIISIIRQVPERLEGLYRSLLNDSHPDDRPQTIKLFQWILFSNRPLTIWELREALALDASMYFKTIAKMRSSPLYIEREEDMPLVISGLSKGLMQVILREEANDVDGTRLGHVEFIHQSALDYLSNGGLDELEMTDKWTSADRGNFQISRSCIKYLRMDEIESSHFRLGRYRDPEGAWSDSGGNIRGSFDKFPLLEYAYEFWLLHVTKINNNGIEQLDLLDLFPWQHETDTLPKLFVLTHQSYMRFRDLSEPQHWRRTVHVMKENWRNSPNSNAVTMKELWRESRTRIEAPGERSRGNSSLIIPACEMLFQVLAFAGIDSALKEMFRRQPSTFQWAEYMPWSSSDSFLRSASEI